MKEWIKYIFKIGLVILILSIILNLFEQLNAPSSIIFGITFIGAFVFGQLVVDLKWRP